MLGLWQRFVQMIRSTRPQLAYAPAHRITALMLAAFFLANATVSEPAAAQISDSKLREMGLQTAWTAQLQMPLESGSIVSTHLWTNPNIKRTFAELTLPKGTYAAGLVPGGILRESADRRGADGNPIGIDAAKRLVESRATRLLGRLPGVAAVEVTQPMITLVVVTSDGIVQAYNAETGERLWLNACGSVRFPASPAGVSDAGIAVAQGPSLFLFDWADGKVLAKRELQRATTAGVAMVDDIAFTASLSGHVSALVFSDPPARTRWSFRLWGRSLASPAASDRAHKMVAFPTNVGIVTVFSVQEKIEPWFNFEAKSPLAGPLTFAGGGLYLSDIHGQVSKIGLDRTGKVEWRTMIDEPLGAPAVVFDGRVYLANMSGYMFACDDTNGQPLWTEATPRVKAVLTGTKDRLLCRSLTDRLLVVDTATGQIVNESGQALIGNSLSIS